MNLAFGLGEPAWWEWLLWGAGVGLISLIAAIFASISFGDAAGRWLGRLVCLLAAIFALVAAAFGIIDFVKSKWGG